MTPERRRIEEGEAEVIRVAIERALVRAVDETSSEPRLGESSLTTSRHGELRRESVCRRTSACSRYSFIRRSRLSGRSLEQYHSDSPSQPDAARRFGSRPGRGRLITVVIWPHGARTFEGHGAGSGLGSCKGAPKARRRSGLGARVG